MAQQQGVQLDQEKFCCSICLYLLKDPVSVPCGHNYCSRCIEEHWNQDDQKGRFSCPQCTETFIPRPVLKKNTMLADMMDLLKKKRLQVVPPDHCYDGPGDVACDFCTRRKQKAVKTCLQCRVSYCDTHLQPHYQSPTFKKHKLVKASSKLQENICSLHDKVKTFFCRTDQKCICSLCCMEEHKGHDTISAAAERTERQKTFDMSQQNIQQRIQVKEKDVKVLYQEVKSINHSADRAVENSDTVFSNLTTSVKRRRSEVRELIRDQQKSEVGRAEEQRKRVEQEVTELKRRHAELEQLSHTEDTIHFLHRYTSLSRISESTHPVSSNVHHQRSFEDVTVAVSKVRDRLEDIFKEEGTNISETVNRVDTLLSTSLEPQTSAEFLQTNTLEDVFKIKKIKRAFVMILFFVITLTHPIKSSVQPQGTHMDQLGVQGHLNTNPGWLKPRAEFLQYSCPITLDPNTAHQHLSLSEGNRKATLTEPESYPFNPERTIEVLSRESLTGRCYWEVEWSGYSVGIVFSYKDDDVYDSKRQPEYQAWSLRCKHDLCVFKNVTLTKVYAGHVSSRVGVYLDHSAGILSFYNVSDTMTLLHSVQTTFAQKNLYAGFTFYLDGDTAKLCDLM